MDVLKQAIMYVGLIVAFWGTVAVMKRVSRVQVPPGYADVAGLEEFGSYRVDRAVTATGMRSGDPLCYRLGEDRDHEVYFGWVAGLPGDDVTVVKGALTVNGKAVAHGDPLNLPDCGPLRVPANHLYVVSDHHEFDSVAVGPLPAIAIHGRLASLP